MKSWRWRGLGPLSIACPAPLDLIGARFPHQVSGGQLQRVMVAMALITEPELVLLDEPTTALDVITQVEVLKRIKAALAQSGATALYVSHDLAVVAQVADHIAVLKNGRMCEIEQRGIVLEAPGSECTKTLIAAARPRARTAIPRPLLTACWQFQPLMLVMCRVRQWRSPEVPAFMISFALRRGLRWCHLASLGRRKSTIRAGGGRHAPPSAGRVNWRAILCHLLCLAEAASDCGASRSSCTCRYSA